MATKHHQYIFVTPVYHLHHIVNAIQSLDKLFMHSLIIIIDNSPTNSAPALCELHNIDILYLKVNSNLHFLHSTNLGLWIACQFSCEAIVMLNDDTRAPQFHSNSTCHDLYGPFQFNYKLDISLHSLIRLKKQLSGDQRNDWLEGSCILIDPVIIKRYGFLNPMLEPAYFEEVEYCSRINTSSRLLDKSAIIEHFGSASFPQTTKNTLCSVNSLLFQIRKRKYILNKLAAFFILIVKNIFKKLDFKLLAYTPRLWHQIFVSQPYSTISLMGVARLSPLAKSQITIFQQL